MTGETRKGIDGGCVLIARKMLASPISKKPPMYQRTFILLVCTASYEDGHLYKGHTLNRGELIITYNELSKALSYSHNKRTIYPSVKELRNILAWLESEDMIIVKPLIGGTSANWGRHPVRTGAYLGLKIFVVNFDYYQNLENYSGRHRGRPSDELGQTKKRNRKEVKKPPVDFSSLRERYPSDFQKTIDDTLRAVSSTRTGGKIKDSVKARILESWEEFSVDQVMAGCRIYLEKGYHRQGKKERYLWGIIKNHNGQPGKTPSRSPGPSTADDRAVSVVTCPACGRTVTSQDMVGETCILCAEVKPHA